MTPAKRLIFSASLFTALCNSPADARENAEQPDILNDLIACRAITDVASRLSCFDTTSKNLSDAAASKDIVVIDRDEIQKTKRSLFGFNLPKLPFFSGRDGDDEPEFAQIETTITQAQNAGHDKWAIRIPEGATWKTTEALAFPPRQGQKVMIKAGTLGGYFMKIDGGKSIRAMRVN